MSTIILADAREALALCHDDDHDAWAQWARDFGAPLMDALEDEIAANVALASRRLDDNQNAVRVAKQATEPHE